MKNETVEIAKVEIKKEVKRDSIYYFGIEVSIYKNMPYEDVLYLKIIACKTHISNLYKGDYMANYRQINDVLNRMNEVKDLLNELGYKMPEITKELNRRALPP